MSFAATETAPEQPGSAPVAPSAPAPKADAFSRSRELAERLAAEDQDPAFEVPAVDPSVQQAGSQGLPTSNGVAEGSTAQPAPTVNPVNERLQKLGITTEGEAAVAALADRLEYERQLHEQYQQQVEAFFAQQREPQQPAQPQTPATVDPLAKYNQLINRPQFDETLIEQYVTGVDQETGELKFRPNTPPQVMADATRAHRWSVDAQRRLRLDPVGFYAPVLQEMVKDQLQAVQQQQAQQYQMVNEQASRRDQALAKHAGWFFDKSPDGRPDYSRMSAAGKAAFEQIQGFVPQFTKDGQILEGDLYSRTLDFVVSVNPSLIQPAAPAAAPQLAPPVQPAPVAPVTAYQPPPATPAHATPAMAPPPSLQNSAERERQLWEEFKANNFNGGRGYVPPGTPIAQTPTEKSMALAERLAALGD